MQGIKRNLSQKQRRRDWPAACLTLTGLAMLAGVVVLGLICTGTGLLLWSPDDAKITRIHVAHLPLSNATATPSPTLSPPVTKERPQNIIATATLPPAGAYQTVVARAAAGETRPRATATPPPTSTPSPTATPPPASTAPVVQPDIPAAGGWSFTATRSDTIPARKLLLLYGEMVNNTGAAQHISQVTGTFYNSQGQLIAADKSTYGLWPTNIVPPGGRVPFTLTVYNVPDTADFELSVAAEPVDAAPRQDFEFVTVNQAQVNGAYCLTGALKNPGSQLTDHVIIAAILYDDQGQVLRFSSTRENGVRQVAGDQLLDFETCLKSPPANVARHQLLAWGI